MNIHLIITLAVLLLMIIGFLCGKFKLGLVAMTASTVLCLTGVLTFKTAAVTTRAKPMPASATKMLL